MSTTFCKSKERNAHSRLRARISNYSVYSIRCFYESKNYQGYKSKNEKKIMRDNVNRHFLILKRMLWGYLKHIKCKVRSCKTRSICSWRTVLANIQLMVKSSELIHEIKNCIPYTLSIQSIGSLVNIYRINKFLQV